MYLLGFNCGDLGVDYKDRTGEFVSVILSACTHKTFIYLGRCWR